MTQQDLVKGVRDYALAHYEEDGWDILVECMSDEEIVEEMGEAKDLLTAIQNVRVWCKMRNSRREDIQGEVF